MACAARFATAFDAAFDFGLDACLTTNLVARFAVAFEAAAPVARFPVGEAARFDEVRFTAVFSFISTPVHKA